MLRHDLWRLAEWDLATRASLARSEGRHATARYLDRLALRAKSRRVSSIGAAKALRGLRGLA